MAPSERRSDPDRPDRSDREDTGIGAGTWAEYRRMVILSIEQNTMAIQALQLQMTAMQTIVTRTEDSLKHILGSSGRPGVISQIEGKINNLEMDEVNPLKIRTASLESSRTWVKGLIAAGGLAWTATLAYLGLHR